ncbi:MAPEG family protein [Roseobacter sp. YSTF-M11]|uniref:MAPEG family protein n=1 Tax=Roseobacter insulae TaxID=2859783 RepID=A0A9X1FZR3_9RHOB|nr:MAPEG family protein [Roseobacter insulae]MBW4710284.1 MAPEG family protein [Roseobacter insulae]
MEAGTLSTELGIVIMLSVLAASLWIPYIVGVNIHPQEGVDDFARPPPLTGFPDWVHRAHRAHLNLLEQLLPFALLVLVVDRLGGYSALTFWTAIAFFWLRVAHALGMISGVARFPLRPMIFVGGWLCCLIMAYAAYAA